MQFDNSNNRVIHETIDRNAGFIQQELTPSAIRDLMERANNGSPGELCKLALELEEKNWDIRNSMATRRNTLMGCEWHITPPATEHSSEAYRIAQHFEKALRSAGELNEFDSFQDLISDLSGAVIAPYAVSEIIWDGAELLGFRGIEGRHFSFRDPNGPQLITRDAPEGRPLPPYKFLFHWHHRIGSDICRGGLIRTLAWLHCFQSYPMKDWMAFAERYGMPFLVAKLDRAAYDKDRAAVQNAIRNFGPRGGGIFSKSMEIELLQSAAGNSGTVYEAIISHMSDAITKVILGQLATSGRSSGMSGGDAQSKVRQDILEADAKKIESTIRSGLAAPWTMFHYGPDAPVPVLHFRVEPPEDLTHFAQTLASLYSAGLEADPDEIGKRFGIHLKRKDENESK